jgi:hypothetical protein
LNRGTEEQKNREQRTGEQENREQKNRRTEEQKNSLEPGEINKHKKTPPPRQGTRRRSPAVPPQFDTNREERMKNRENQHWRSTPPFSIHYS